MRFSFLHRKGGLGLWSLVSSWVLSLSLNLTLHPHALAQTSPPDAGSLRQGIEQLRSPALPSPALEAPKPPEPAPPREPSGATVTVESFRFVGNTLLDDASLRHALVPFLHRPLDFDGLERATAAVATAYREAGWLVRAFLPEQGIEGGLVTIEVVEARFGGVRLEGAAPAKVLAEQVAAFVSAGQTLGQPLQAHQLDRALLLAGDLPGVNVSGTLVPGPAEGQTSVLIESRDQPWLFGDVGMDNHGARATGSLRQSANLNLNSPGLRGELINLALLHSEGSDYTRLALTVPVGQDGLRLGFNGSVMRYTVVAGPSANSVSPIRGSSGSLGMELSYPLLRAQMANLSLTSALETKNFYNADTQVHSDYASDSLRLGMSGNRFDDLGQGGVNSASAQWHGGRLGNIVAHPLQQRLAGGWRKLSYSASRQQTFTPQHSLVLSWNGQHATQLLDSSEKFYVGGAGSVRAYPSSELSGERGQTLAAEWRWRVLPEWTLSAFWDHGRATALPATDGEAATRLRLSGRGLAAAWQGMGGLNTRLVWAHRNGNNPRPMQTGTDSDGTLDRNRLWLNVSWNF